MDEEEIVTVVSTENDVVADVLRIINDMTMGDLVIASCLLLLIFYFILRDIFKILWR